MTGGTHILGNPQIGLRERCRFSNPSTGPCWPPLFGSCKHRNIPATVMALYQLWVLITPFIGCIIPFITNHLCVINDHNCRVLHHLYGVSPCMETSTFSYDVSAFPPSPGAHRCSSMVSPSQSPTCGGRICWRWSCKRTPKRMWAAGLWRNQRFFPSTRVSPIFFLKSIPIIDLNSQFWII